ncbi:hypothetical protein ACLOJK_031429 [Asimina triloba]
MQQGDIIVFITGRDPLQAVPSTSLQASLPSRRRHCLRRRQALPPSKSSSSIGDICLICSPRRRPSATMLTVSQQARRQPALPLPVYLVVGRHHCPLCLASHRHCLLCLASHRQGSPLVNYLDRVNLSSLRLLLLFEGNRIGVVPLIRSFVVSFGIDASMLCKDP